MRKILILCFAMLYCIVNIHGQVNIKNGAAVFEDKEGETSIHWPGGSVFRVNTQDASLKLAYSHLYKDSLNHPTSFGFDLSGKTYDGIMPLLSSNRITPGLKTNITWGYFLSNNNKDISKCVSWVALKLGYEGTKFKLIQPDSSFDTQIQQKVFDGFNASLLLNFIPKNRNDLLIGFAIGWRHTNNYGSLDDIEMTEKNVYTDNSSGTSRTIEKKISGKSGSYKVYNSFNVKEDLFWIAVPRIGIYQYIRLQDKDKFIYSSGLGAFLLNEKDIFSSKAGIVFEIEDLGNIKSGLSNNLSINFVVGFNFGK